MVQWKGQHLPEGRGFWVVFLWEQNPAGAAGRPPGTGAEWGGERRWHQQEFTYGSSVLERQGKRRHLHFFIIIIGFRERKG